MKNALKKQAIFIALLLLSVKLSYAITAEIRRVSDNAVVSSLDFGSILNTGVYAQGADYLVITYAPGEADNLKLISNNASWIGSSPDMGGLVETPNPVFRVPVYWTAYDSPQTGVSLTNLNQSSWKNIKDQNDPSFSAYDPSNINVPAFASGTTYIYFGGKLDPGTPVASYLGALMVSNQEIVGNNLITSNGFDPFDGVLRLDREQLIQIPYNVKSSGNVVLTVFDRKGDLIRTLVSGDHTPGKYTTSWDGRNDKGDKMGSGVFIVHLQVGDGKEKHVKKVALIR